ncbi:MAG: hypothetical protein RR854_08845 [Muribaculaceae bacterium]
MKKSIIFILGTLLVTSSYAQDVKISDSDILKKDNQVMVSFNAEVSKISTNAKLTITPVIYSGTNSKSLRPIIVSGRNKSITDSRAGINDGATRTKKDLLVHFYEEIPYQEWMSDLSLRIDRKIESCCNEKFLASTAIIDNKVIYSPEKEEIAWTPISPIAKSQSALTDFDGESPFLASMEDYKVMAKDFDVMRADGALIVYFRQGHRILDPNYEGNKQSLDQIKKVMAMIDADPNATLGKIVIAGASSPEGTLRRNEFLAQKRADALKKYLGIKAASKDDLFELITVGEDWSGLCQMVEASDMKHKELVLETIKKYPVTGGRENELMKLKGGRPYNYMLKHFFPKLRSAGYIRIYYDAKPTAEFKATNEAIELYNNRSFSEALMRLDRVPATATTEDMRGLCMMMLGDYDKAEVTLNNAIKLGSADAVKHLEELRKKTASK